MLLQNGQSDLGDVFHAVQRAASIVICSHKSKIIMSQCRSVIPSAQCLHPGFLQLQTLWGHRHSLPKKGWPVRSSDLWTWSVYNILALSSLANVIVTKLFLSVVLAQYFLQGSSVPPACSGPWCPCNTSAGWQVATQLLSSVLIQREIFLNLINIVAQGSVHFQSNLEVELSSELTVIETHNFPVITIHVWFGMKVNWTPSDLL